MDSNSRKNSIICWGSSFHTFWYNFFFDLNLFTNFPTAKTPPKLVILYVYVNVLWSFFVNIAKIKENSYQGTWVRINILLVSKTMRQTIFSWNNKVHFFLKKKIKINKKKIIEYMCYTNLCLSLTINFTYINFNI